MRNYNDIAEPEEGDQDWSPHYAAALRGKIEPIQELAPQPGYYRHKDISGKWKATAFWHGTDGLLCLNSGSNAYVRDRDEQGRLWLFCAKRAIAKKIFFEVYESGRWPDGSDDMLAETPRGSNLPDDQYEALKLQVEGKIEFAKDWLRKHPKAETKEAADTARNYEEQLRKLKAEADPMFKLEKQPFLDACRKTDNRYRFRDDLEKLARELKALWENFAREETKRQKAEASKRHREEMAAAEAARKAQEEEMRRLAADDPALAYITTPEPEIPLPEAPKAEKIMIGGGFGKRASVSRTYTGKIVDYQAVAKHFLMHPDTIRHFQKLVDDAVKKNKGMVSIPGVEVRDDLGDIAGSDGRALPC